MRNLKIVICTRSMNYFLYKNASQLMTLDFPKYRYTNTTADGYIYQCIKTKADIVINYDEDAFLLNKKALLDLIEYVCDNNIACCGMPDGGVACRDHNPIVINPFFCIFNLIEIRKFYNMDEINNFAYEDHKEKLMDKFPMELLTDYKRVRFDDTTFEPYYPFFLWLASNSQVFYLNSSVHADGLSTILYNHQNEPFIIHTWYSREYGRDTYHTDRINDVIVECIRKRGLNLHVVNENLGVKCVEYYDRLSLQFWNFKRRIRRFIAKRIK